MQNRVKNIDDYSTFEDKRKAEKIFDNENASIIHLVFKEGQGLPEHTTHVDAFLMLVSGFAILEMEGEEYALDPNDTILLPAGIPHALWAKEDSKLILFR